MSEAKDPEQLLADALRAQAAFAPQVSTPAADHPTDRVPATPDAAALPAAYGLLSGAGEGSLERERAALEAADAPTTFAPLPAAETTRQPVASAQLPAHWILLLAVLLGLAAGSVVGLLTLV